MSIKTLKPTSAGMRGMSKVENHDITTDKPHKPLLTKLKKHSGRNSYGRITTRHKGGGETDGPIGQPQCGLCLRCGEPVEVHQAPRGPLIETVSQGLPVAREPLRRDPEIRGAARRKLVDPLSEPQTPSSDADDRPDVGRPHDRT